MARLVTLPARQLLDRDMKESQLGHILLDMAHAYGWRAVHWRPAMNERGHWHTAYQGDGRGFPDWLILKAGRLLCVELEREGVKCPPEQIDYLKRLAAITEVESFVWRPHDRDTMARVLSGQPVDSLPLR